MSQPQRPKRWKLALLILLAALALTAGAAVSQRHALRTWYLAYRFEQAAESDRQVWADKLVEMGEPAVPRLIAHFRKDDEALCQSSRGCLERLLADWGPDDPRSDNLADRFFELQPSFSPHGQVAALQLLFELLKSKRAEVIAKARVQVSSALKDKAVAQRVVGIAVAPELNLLPEVVPLLDDPEADVRWAAMLILGPLPDAKKGAAPPLVSSDDLLRWLHDPDERVRDRCRMSLSARGLSDQVIRMGKTLTDPDPMVRLQLLLDLPARENIDMLVWLRRLSNDSSSAVRAGAARVAAEQHVDFAERLEQMSQSDPDGSVRKIAEHYRKLYR